jgi:hypothetical protein
VSVYSLNHVRPEQNNDDICYLLPHFSGLGVRVQPEPCASGTVGARPVHAVARTLRPLRLARRLRCLLRFYRHRGHAGKHLKGLCHEIGVIFWIAYKIESVPSFICA